MKKQAPKFKKKLIHTFADGGEVGLDNLSDDQMANYNDAPDKDAYLQTQGITSADAPKKATGASALSKVPGVVGQVIGVADSIGKPIKEASEARDPATGLLANEQQAKQGYQADQVFDPVRNTINTFQTPGMTGWDKATAASSFALGPLASLINPKASQHYADALNAPAKRALEQKQRDFAAQKAGVLGYKNGGAVEAGDSTITVPAKIIARNAEDTKAYIDRAKTLLDAQNTLNTTLRTKLKLPATSPIPDNATLSPDEVKAQVPNYYDVLGQHINDYAKHGYTGIPTTGGKMQSLAGFNEGDTPLDQTAYGPLHRSVKFSKMTTTPVSPALQNIGVEGKAQGGDVLSAKERKSLPTGSFAIPSKRAYPIHDLCLAGNTLIKLLNGTSIAIKELVGKEVWLYSYNITKTAIVPAKATDIRKTLSNVETLRIYLDNEKFIECTDNHPLLMRDGNYKRADQLEVGDSLMPFYYDYKSILGGKNYERVYQVWYKKWDFTHIMVNREYTGQFRLDNEVVHHKNNNQLDNEPNNLETMDRSAHCRLHGELYGWKHVPILSAAANKRWADDIDGVSRKRQSEFMKAENKRRNDCGEMYDIGQKISQKKLKYSREDALKFHAIYLAGESYTNIAKLWNCNRTAVKLRFKREGLALKTEIFAHNNHKILRIENGECQDVYDLTVEGTHNFGLECGIFVHNSHARNALARVSEFGTASEKAQVRAAVKKRYPDIEVSGKAAGGPVDDPSGEIKGPGTAKSDSIKAKVEPQSFIVPAEHSHIVKMLDKTFPFEEQKTKDADVHQDGETRVNLSDGEMLISPEKKAFWESHGVNVNALAPNAKNTSGKKDGGYAEGTPEEGVPELDVVRKKHKEIPKTTAVAKKNNYAELLNYLKPEANPVTDNGAEDIVKSVQGPAAESYLTNNPSLKNVDKTVSANPTTQSVATTPITANRSYDLPTFIGLGQTVLGGAMYSHAGKRPVDVIDPTYANSVLNATKEAGYGISPQERALAENNIEGVRRAENAAIMEAAGGQGSVALGNMRAANTGSQEALAKLSAESERMRQQKTQYANSLISRQADMRRQLFEDKMNSFNTNQSAAGELLGAGLANVVGAQHYNQQKDYYDKLLNNSNTGIDANAYLKAAKTI